jgi:hypothetical protein
MSAYSAFSDVDAAADPSAVMVESCAWLTTAPVVRSDGGRLPFRSGAFAGAWIERVLMHVEDPIAVLAETVRCVAAGGLLTIFEPDWSSMTVNGAPVPHGWTPPSRHPAIGSEVGALLARLGCVVRDRVEERSWWTKASFEAIIKRTVPGPAESLSAEMVKVCWVATTPS